MGRLGSIEHSNRRGRHQSGAANARGAWLIQAAAREGGFTAIHNLAREIDSRETPQTQATVYVAGVCTDMKVQTLLVGLRTQYDLEGSLKGFKIRVSTYAAAW